MRSIISIEEVYDRRFFGNEGVEVGLRTTHPGHPEKVEHYLVGEHRSTTTWLLYRHAQSPDPDPITFDEDDTPDSLASCLDLILRGVD